jgi:hypothetical protein
MMIWKETSARWSRLYADIKAQKDSLKAELELGATSDSGTEGSSKKRRCVEWNQGSCWWGVTSQKKLFWKLDYSRDLSSWKPQWSHEPTGFRDHFSWDPPVSWEPYSQDPCSSRKHRGSSNHQVMRLLFLLLRLAYNSWICGCTAKI